MSRITLHSLNTLQTLNSTAMAETTGGLGLSRIPFPFPRPRLRCFFIRIPFFPFRRRICVPVLRF